MVVIVVNQEPIHISDYQPEAVTPVTPAEEQPVTPVTVEEPQQTEQQTTTEAEQPALADLVLPESKRPLLDMVIKPRKSPAKRKPTKKTPVPEDISNENSLPEVTHESIESKQVEQKRQE